MKLKPVQLIDLDPKEAAIALYIFERYINGAEAPKKSDILAGTGLGETHVAYGLKNLRRDCIIKFSNLPGSGLLYELTDYGIHIAKLISILGYKMYSKIKGDYAYV